MVKMSGLTGHKHHHFKPNPSDRTPIDPILEQERALRRQAQEEELRKQYDLKKELSKIIVDMANDIKMKGYALGDRDALKVADPKDAVFGQRSTTFTILKPLKIEASKLLRKGFDRVRFSDFEFYRAYYPKVADITFESRDSWSMRIFSKEHTTDMTILANELAKKYNANVNIKAAP
jgi:hypothetical protein